MAIIKPIYMQRWPLFLAAMFCLGWSSNIYAEPVNELEHQIKAAFLYNFTKFTVWPDGAFSDPNQPLRLCMLGEHPFGEALKTIEGSTVRGHQLVVASLKDLPIDGCQILYVGAGVAVQTMQDISAHARSAHILTVSDRSDFIRQGGMIQLVMVERKVRFEVHQARIKAAKLKLSSRLLRLARKVHGLD